MDENLLHCPKCNGEFPSQGRGRYVTIIETIRANQQEAGWILVCLSNGDNHAAQVYLDNLYKTDRDALLQPNGILSDAQIELLK